MPTDTTNYSTLKEKLKGTQIIQLNDGDLIVKRRTLDEVVRALWVSSLILSIASAINSQLAMHCEQPRSFLQLKY